MILRRFRLAAELSQEQLAYAGSDVLHLHALKAKLDAPLPELAAEQVKWEETLHIQPTWTTLEPGEMQSASGATLAREADGSILTRGKPICLVVTLAGEDILPGAGPFVIQPLREPVTGYERLRDWADLRGVICFPRRLGRRSF